MSGALEATIDKLRRWWAGQGDRPNVGMYCPESDREERTEEMRVATGKTTPVASAEDDEGAVACRYHCSYCGNDHVYLWNIAPAPVYVGDGTLADYGFALMSDGQ